MRYNYSQILFQWEDTKFTVADGQKHIRDNVMIIACLLVFYVMLVYLLPKYFKGRRGMNLRYPSILYNTGMSFFSLFGAVCLGVQGVYMFKDKSVYASVCSCDYYFQPPSILATYFFSWSKPVELLDTVILLLRGRVPILLHWYHHVSVVVIGMNNYVHPQPTGLWCGTMNYSIHFLMYGYYALMLTPAKKLVASFSIVITTLQLTQMVVAFLLHCYVYYEIVNGGDCDATAGSILMTGFVYLTYWFLFAKYFVDRYRTKSKKE